MFSSWIKYLSGHHSPHYEDTDVFETTYGPVRGKCYAVNNGAKVNAFLGIPYAKNERFMKPEPCEPWTEVLECKRFGERCPHVDLLLEMPFLEAPKGENCLNLNVFAPTWTPGPDQRNGFATLFFIHGGGFTIHSSSHYGDYGICKALCTKDVVVVTINYRLGYFGFLSTGDDHCPGNMGLWDMAAALLWVKNNIAAFGGDPNNITVFGQSAGGAAADYLSLSPYTRDLFRRVITMAGTAEHSFSVVDSEDNRNKTLEFARSLGFRYSKNAPMTEVNRHLVHFLRHQPADKLERALLSFAGFHLNDKVSLDIAPVIDGDFLPANIDVLRKETGKKEILSGTTKYEGLFLSFRPHRSLTLAEVKDIMIKALENKGYEVTEELIEEMLDVYLQGDLTDKRFVTKAYINIMSDLAINIAQSEYNVKMTRLGHKVYQYVFEYCNKRNMGLLGHALAFRGATHCSELAYIFHKGVLANFHPNANDLRMVEKMTKLWTNFAKYGNPNGKVFYNEWEPLEPEDPYKYYRIDLECALEKGLHKNRMAKISKILSAYSRCYHDDTD